MKTARFYRLAVLCFVLCAAIFVTGCTQSDRSGNTIDEPDITVEYLAGEYAKQLMRDNAECIFGSIEIETGEDGGNMLQIEAKEYVKDSEQPNGFYIADKNMNYTYPLSPEARTTFLSGGTSIAKVMTAGQFVEAVHKDLEENGKSNPGYAESKFYDLYVMNDQIELVIARYIP